MTDQPIDRVHQAIASLAAASSPLSRDDRFFHDCVKRLAETYQAKFAFIGLFSDESKTSITTHAIWVGDRWADNFSYDLLGTPCADVLSYEQVFIPCDAATEYPDDAMLVDMQIDSYFGCDLLSPVNGKLGLVVVADTKPMEEDPWILTVLQLYADRIAMELDKGVADQEAALAASVFEGSMQAIMIADPDNCIRKVNPAFSEITGWAAEDIEGQPLSVLASGHHDEQVFEEIDKALAEEGRWQGELWSRRKNGEIYPEQRSVVVVKGDDGELKHYVNIFSDISTEKFAAERIQRLAYYDPVSDLPNRQLFQEKLSHFLERSEGSNKFLALLFFDLDGFKLINDTLGHAAGDKLIQIIAERLTERLSKADLIARIGGDEFAIVACLEHAEEVRELTEELLALVSQPCELENQKHSVTASVGISLHPSDGDTVQTLIKHADAAMYQAKEQGKNRYVFFEPKMNQWAVARLETIAQLRKAIAEKQFQLHYQPIYDTAGEKVVAIEALVRWIGDNGHLIMPGDFIPVAEDSGLIVPLGEWVLCEACRQAHTWWNAGLDFGRISVNISGRQFQEEGLVEVVGKALTHSGLPPLYLELEITESCAMSGPQEAVTQLEELRDLGVSLAIDDFGIAYSSMSYLKGFPVTRLKIDRAFVRDIPDDADDAAITAAIVAMGHSLGLDVVAEGVETEEQHAFLKSVRCDEIQGFMLGKPMPEDKMTLVLQHQSRSDEPAFSRLPGESSIQKAL